MDLFMGTDKGARFLATHTAPRFLTHENRTNYLANTPSRSQIVPFTQRAIFLSLSLSLSVTTLLVPVLNLPSYFLCRLKRTVKPRHEIETLGVYVCGESGHSAFPLSELSLPMASPLRLVEISILLLVVVVVVVSEVAGQGSTGGTEELEGKAIVPGI